MGKKSGLKSVVVSGKKDVLRAESRKPESTYIRRDDGVEDVEDTH